MERDMRLLCLCASTNITRINKEHGSTIVSLDKKQSRKTTKMRISTCNSKDMPLLFWLGLLSLFLVEHALQCIPCVLSLCSSSSSSLSSSQLQNQTSSYYDKPSSLLLSTQSYKEETISPSSHSLSKAEVDDDDECSHHGEKHKNDTDAVSSGIIDPLDSNELFTNLKGFDDVETVDDTMRRRQWRKEQFELKLQQHQQQQRLHRHHNLQHEDAAGDKTQAQRSLQTPNVECIRNFTAEVVVRVSKSFLNATQEEIRQFEKDFQLSFNEANGLNQADKSVENKEKCDPFRRQITNVSADLEFKFNPGIVDVPIIPLRDRQRRRMKRMMKMRNEPNQVFHDESMATPTTLRKASSSSSSYRGSRRKLQNDTDVGLGDLSQNNVEEAVELPDDDFVSILLFIAAICTSCPSEQNLFDDVSNYFSVPSSPPKRRRQLEEEQQQQQPQLHRQQHLLRSRQQQQDRRKLQNNTFNLTPCIVCPADAEVRGTSTDEALFNYVKAFQGIEYEVEEFVEVDSTVCPDTSDVYTVETRLEIVLQFDLSSSLSGQEALARLFKSEYNGLTEEFCDTKYRSIVDVRIDTSNLRPNLVGERVSVPFIVQVQCLGDNCAAGSELFFVRQRRRRALRSLNDNRNLQSDQRVQDAPTGGNTNFEKMSSSVQPTSVHHRLLSEAGSNICYCDSQSIGDRVPTAAEFLVAYQNALDGEDGEGLDNQGEGGVVCSPNSQGMVNKGCLCYRDLDCAGGLLCEINVCTESSPQERLTVECDSEIGCRCNDNSDCDSGYCNDVCEFPPSFGECAFCNGNPKSCASGVCPAGECSGYDGLMPEFCLCANDNNCRGNLRCIDGLCIQQLGACAPCYDDEMCISGECRAGECTGLDGLVPVNCACFDDINCRGALRCTNGICTPPGLLDDCADQCFDDTECKSELCIGGQCASDFVETGCGCNIDHDCISKNCNRGRCASPIVLDKCADPCIDDAQCGGGQCMGGQCGIAGEVEFGCGCNINGDCLSKNCDKGVCGEPFNLDECSDPCFDDKQCREGNCMGNQCGIAGSVEFGCGCNIDGDCSSKNCVKGVCGDLIVLPACSDECFDDVQCGKGSSCRGGQCGVIEDIELGCGCLFSSDCKSSLCSLGTCQNPNLLEDCGKYCTSDDQCDSGQSCVAGQCGTPGKIGLGCECDGNKDCRSGFCSSQVSLSVCQAPNCQETCTEGSQCISGLCIAGQCASGVGEVEIDCSCTENRDCLSTICKKGVCVGETVLPCGEPCTDTAECLSGESCMGGQCSADFVGLGCGCNTDGDCFSKNCINNICEERIKIADCDGTCFDDAQCAGGNCMGGQCGIAGSVEVGCGCNDDGNCKTKNCDNNVCGDLIVLSICNESCFDDIQCGEGGTCRGQCGILGEIECGCKCEFDDDCISNKCDGGICGSPLLESCVDVCTKNCQCKSNRCVDGQCTGGVDNLSTCSVDGDCKSCNCFFGQCEDPNLIGDCSDPCTQNSQCSSGLCVAGQCGRAGQILSDCNCNDNEDCQTNYCSTNGKCDLEPPVN